MKYIIYEIKNNVNNKIYVGVHQLKNISDNYMGSGKLIKQAIVKYGIEHFTKSILYEYENKKDAYEKEKIIVDEHFVTRKDTYNLMEGGHGGKTCSGETHPAWGKISSFYGKYHSDESRNKISMNRKGKCVGNENPMYDSQRFGILNPFYNQIHSDESRNNISMNRKGKCVGRENRMYDSKPYLFSHTKYGKIICHQSYIRNLFGINPTLIINGYQRQTKGWAVQQVAI